MKGRHRNKPCECGSGLKFKKCCLGAGETVKTVRKKRVQSTQAQKATAAAWLALGGMGYVTPKL